MKRTQERACGYICGYIQGKPSEYSAQVANSKSTRATLHVYKRETPWSTDRFRLRVCNIGGIVLWCAARFSRSSWERLNVLKDYPLPSLFSRRSRETASRILWRESSMADFLFYPRSFPIRAFTRPIFHYWEAGMEKSRRIDLLNVFSKWKFRNPQINISKKYVKSQSS